MKIDVKIKILEESLGAKAPFYATEQSAGVDLCAALPGEVIIGPGEIKLIPTGIAVAMPIGYEAQIRPRSGLALKNGITVLNTPGTIDSDYRGEIKVILINHSKEDFAISNGMRIAQMVFAAHATADFAVVDDLDGTTRGHGGFGSTGV